MIIMYNVQLTAYLRSILKDLRKNSNLRGDTLSKELKKGASYLYQIEAGKIKETSLDNLTSIFQKISNTSNEDFPNFIISLIDQIVDTHELPNLENEAWIKLYDVEYRMYNITDNIIMYITDALEKHDISSQEIINKINTHEENNSNIIPLFNDVLYPLLFKNACLNQCFNHSHFLLKDDYLEKIIKKEITQTNYAFMAGIIYFLDTNYNMSQQQRLRNCHKILFKNNFFTIDERYANYSANATQTCEHEYITIREFVLKNTSSKRIENYHSLLVDNLYKKLLTQVDSLFLNLFTKNPSHATTALTSFIQNMEDNPELMNDLISSPIYSIPPTLKKEFWNEYIKLLTIYINKSKAEQDN